MRKVKEAPQHQIPVLDLNQSAYQHLRGNTPNLELQGSRVVFLFNPDETFYNLSQEYNSNVPVNCLDFVQALRELKSRMMNLKGGDRHAR